MLNESNCKANPPPQKEEEEEDNSEEEGEQDGEEEPGVSQSQQVFKEVRRPVHLLEDHQVIGSSMNREDQVINPKRHLLWRLWWPIGENKYENW